MTSETRLLACALGGLLMLIGGVALVSTAAALITAGLCTVASTATVAYLRGAK